MENKYEFDTTAGAGSEVVTIVYRYEHDGETSYNENIEEVWFEGRNVIGLFSDEQFKEMECEAAMRFQHHKQTKGQEEDYQP